MARTMEHYTLSWAFHDAKPESLKLGDHIYKWTSPTHAYHGIIVQQESTTETQVNGPRDSLDCITVLRLPCSCCGNFMRAERETLTSFEARSRKLLIGGGLKVARYGVPGFETWIKRYGTCYAQECSPVSEVLCRAEILLQQETLERTKCEHLAFWCKTGIWQPQIDGTRRAVMCSLGAAACASVRLHPAAGIVALAGGGLLRHIAFQPQSRPEASAGASDDSTCATNEDSDVSVQTDSQSEHSPAEHVAGPVFTGQSEASPSLEEIANDTMLDEYVVVDAPGHEHTKWEKAGGVEDSLHKQAQNRQMSSKFGKGEVVQLQGQSGWVRPDIDFMMTIGFEIEQKLIKMNKDLRKKANKPFGEDNVVFLRVSDVAQKGLVLKVGTMIQFKLYTFDEGVGACEIKKA